MGKQKMPGAGAEKRLRSAAPRRILWAMRGEAVP
jgi:hypothetical protein